MFDLAADPEEISKHLAHDPLLADRIASRPGLRVPGSWDGFELAVRAILGQQVTVRGATTLTGRLVRTFGVPIAQQNGLTHVFPSAEKLTDSDLTRIGIPRARAHCLRTMARAVSEGRIVFSGVVNVEEFLSRLRELPGIGDWTAQYIAMRALGEPDAFPSSDLGLFHATGIHQARKLEQRSQNWRPWRAYAAMYLWQGVSHADHVLHANRQPARAAVAGGGRSGFAAD